MAQKTVLNVRTDTAIKRAAQKAAKELGISLSTVVNASLREFIRNPRIELEPLVPNTKTAKSIRLARKESKTKRFTAAREMFDTIEKSS